MKLDEEVLGLNARILTLGFEHESNGRAEPLSRSWNRIYGMVVAEKSNLTLALKAWYRIPEKASEDNNPDITHYLGYGELYAYYKYDDHILGMMFRPAFSGGFKSGLQLDWSFPLFKNLQGYVQYYNGYGESLIDYNHYNNRIGVGIMLNNWL
jgi:phospholipase A1